MPTTYNQAGFYLMGFFFGGGGGEGRASTPKKFPAVVIYRSI